MQDDETAPHPLERGASAVEAAIVTPVVVAMLFGIIEFGMLFKDYLGTQAMLRAGVRVGVGRAAQLDLRRRRRRQDAGDRHRPEPGRT